MERIQFKVSQIQSKKEQWEWLQMDFPSFKSRGNESNTSLTGLSAAVLRKPLSKGAKAPACPNTPKGRNLGNSSNRTMPRVQCLSAGTHKWRKKLDMTKELWHRFLQLLATDSHTGQVHCQKLQGLPEFCC